MSTKNPYLQSAKPEPLDFRQSREQQFYAEKTKVMRAVALKLFPEQMDSWRAADTMAFNQIQNELRTKEVTFDPIARITEARQSWETYVGGGLLYGRKRLQSFLPHVMKTNLRGRLLQAGAVPDAPAPSGESTAVPIVEAASGLLDYTLLDFCAAGEVTRTFVEDQSAVAHWVYGVLISAADRSIENAILRSSQENNIGIFECEDVNQSAGDLASAGPEAIAKCQMVGDVEPDLLVAHPMDFANFRANQDDPTRAPETYCWGLTPIITAACPQGKAVVMNSGSVEITTGLRDTVELGHDWKGDGVLVIFTARRSISVIRPRGITVINSGS